MLKTVLLIREYVEREKNALKLSPHDFTFYSRSSPFVCMLFILFCIEAVEIERQEGLCFEIYAKKRVKSCGILRNWAHLCIGIAILMFLKN